MQLKKKEPSSGNIDKQYEKFFFELAHPNDEVIIDKEDEKI